MKLSGITILLAGIATMGANAQVLKGTASSSNPRRRFNKMKEADRRRLQTTIACVGIGGGSSKNPVDGYGSGCFEEDGSVSCTKDSNCNSVGYNECFDSGTNPTNTCVCIIPVPGSGSTQCKDDFGGTKSPCCTEG